MSSQGAFCVMLIVFWFWFPGSGHCEIPSSCGHSGYVSNGWGDLGWGYMVLAWIEMVVTQWVLRTGMQHGVWLDDCQPDSSAPFSHNCWLDDYTVPQPGVQDWCKREEGWVLVKISNYRKLSSPITCTPRWLKSEVSSSSKCFCPDRGLAATPRGRQRYARERFLAKGHSMQLSPGFI